MDWEGGAYERMAIGEEGRPQGVGVGGMRATGVKGGEGREERPVPPIMAIGTGSGGGVSGFLEVAKRGPCLRMWRGGCPYCVWWNLWRVRSGVEG